MPTIDRPPIVIDTNVLISAGLLPRSRTAEALAVAVEHFVIAQNEATWSELETRIARPKFDRYFGDDGRLRHLIQIARSIRMVPPASSDAVSRDSDDDKFIQLALDAGATMLISGDLDLKMVRGYKGIEILSPALFLARLEVRK
ncbi:MAG: putative toxin-antitoxin system toxin component, PIN family [Burkholderiales bacterium]|nr:putative toxin-antitoxin system toxin component, PIN family [Burkholderiales bacterium]MBK8667652.1 putative toxin-antitoxin system toxin component, PIN family [Burkholderiales bacterium]